MKSVFQYRRVWALAAVLLGSVLVLWIWLSPSKQTSEVEVYFSPGGGAREAIITSIQSATSRVYVAMFYMSSAEIVA
ncbi:MAG TPA: hypothetical protein PJ991_11635, partial [Kiritimatiellia bacterium]|nr:hypothetical protein [Kiritimatiellia bacterium]